MTRLTQIKRKKPYFRIINLKDFINPVMFEFNIFPYIFFFIFPQKSYMGRTHSHTQTNEQETNACPHELQIKLHILQSFPQFMFIFTPLVLVTLSCLASWLF